MCGDKIQKLLPELMPVNRWRAELVLRIKQNVILVGPPGFGPGTSAL